MNTATTAYFEQILEALTEVPRSARLEISRIDTGIAEARWDDEAPHIVRIVATDEQHLALTQATNDRARLIAAEATLSNAPASVAVATITAMARA